MFEQYEVLSKVIKLSNVRNIFPLHSIVLQAINLSPPNRPHSVIRKNRYRHSVKGMVLAHLTGDA